MRFLIEPVAHKFAYIVLLLMVVLGFAAPSASAERVADAVRFDEEEISIPAYVRIVGADAAAEDFIIPDSLFYEISGKTIFKVNKTRLNTDDSFVIELAEKVLPLANSKGWQLEAIELRGAASPEGPYQNNVRLSIGRAKALSDFITSRLENVNTNRNLGDITVTKTIAEDYPYLLWLLTRDGDFAAPYLRDIMQKHGNNPAAIKREMQALYGGRVWKRLLRDYFPRTRAAKVVLFFSRLYPDAPKLDSIDFLPEPPLTEAWPENPADAPFLPYKVERRHLMSVGTNLLYDGAYIPNYGWAPMPNVIVEFFPRRGNFSFLAEFMWPYYHKWTKHKFFQIRDYHLEARYWFRPGLRNTGFYTGLYVNNSIFGIGFDKKRGWQGEGLGGGLKLGYAVNLGKSRWRMDFYVAVGAYHVWYDPYVYGNPLTGVEDGDYYYNYTGAADAFVKRNHRLLWYGPTEVGITLTYDVLFHRNYKRGASFRRYDKITHP